MSMPPNDPAFYEADRIQLSAANEVLRMLPWLLPAAISLIVIAVCLVAQLIWQLLAPGNPPPAGGSESMKLAAFWTSGDSVPRERRLDFTMVGSFDPGKLSPKSGRLEWLSGNRTIETCAAWSELASLGDSRAPLVVVVIGGHDLTPLNAKTRVQFGSNENLALQRAQLVATNLGECDPKRPNALVLTIVSGSTKADNPADRTARIKVLRGD